MTNPSDEITFSTDRLSYAESDTIHLSLKNNSAVDITSGLRCGAYLEMFYQKREIEKWSDNLWFWYMSLRCPTHLNTIKAKTTFAHSIPAAILDSTGTFRLLVTFHSLQPDSSLTLVSNVFQIK